MTVKPKSYMEFHMRGSFSENMSYKIKLQIEEHGGFLNIWVETMDSFQDLTDYFTLPVRPGKS